MGLEGQENRQHQFLLDYNFCLQDLRIEEIQVSLAVAIRNKVQMKKDLKDKGKREKL